MTKSRLFAGAALAGALTAGGAGAQVTPDPGLSATRNANQQAAQPGAVQAFAHQGGIGDLDAYWDKLQAQGKITAAQHEKLDQDAEAKVNAMDQSFDRSVQRTPIASNRLQIQQQMENTVQASKSHDTGGIVEGLANTQEQLSQGALIPVNTLVSERVDNIVQMHEQMLQETAELAPSQEQAVAKAISADHSMQRSIDTDIYQERVKLETAIQNWTPAQRAAAAAKLQKAIDSGQLAWDADGGIVPGPNFPQAGTTQPPASPAPGNPPPSTDQGPASSGQSSDAGPGQSGTPSAGSNQGAPTKTGHGAGDTADQSGANDPGLSASATRPAQTAQTQPRSNAAGADQTGNSDPALSASPPHASPP
ncbi:MAG TPA: hypothetical protein VFC47_12740, partial [Caulobacteraceae bacterium]|nr:hypothetical protein [Caulobacteraceae bacterium]